MLPALTKLKTHLSHVDPKTWHFQMFSFVWRKKASQPVIGRMKACTYYWIYLPTSVVGLGILLVFMVIIWTFGILAGYIPKIKDDPDNPEDTDMFYPYKTKPNGRKFRVAPWEIAATVCLLAVFVWLANNINVVKIIGIVIAGIFALGVLGFLLMKGWKSTLSKELRAVTHSSISRAWNKACPPLVVKPSDDKAGESA